MEVLCQFIIWSHIITASLSLVAGAWVLFNSKGSAMHKSIGRNYFYLMIINNVTSLFIYKVTGGWFFPHTLAVATLIILIPGYLITYRKNYRHWLKVHIISFVISYYMLIGGAINELFVHVSSLTPFLSNGSPVMGMTHFAAQLFFLILLIFFLVKHRKTATTI